MEILVQVKFLQRAPKSRNFVKICLPYFCTILYSIVFLESTNGNGFLLSSAKILVGKVKVNIFVTSKPTWLPSFYVTFSVFLFFTMLHMLKILSALGKQ